MANQVIDFTLLKPPITVVGVDRSGTTFLSNLILDYFQHHKNIKLKFFWEPPIEQLESEVLNCKEDYLLKILSYQTELYQTELMLPIFKNSTLIRIRRKSLENHIASHYLAVYRQSVGDKEAWYNRYNTSSTNAILIDKVQLREYAIPYILKQRYICDKIEKYAKIDYDLYYENIKNMHTAKIQVTKKPINYLDLILEIKSLLLKEFNIDEQT